MRSRSKVTASLISAALIGATLPTTAAAQPDAVVDALARDLHISTDQARTRLVQQARAHQADESLAVTDAGRWFDPDTGRLTVAVTSDDAANAVRAAGAEPKRVPRDRRQLGLIVDRVRSVGADNIRSYGIDVVGNDVVVTVTRPTDRFAGIDGVRVVVADQRFTQQTGEVNPGDPWWPGSESNCSVGFPATDSSGGKHFVTAGHCTNDANQAAYGESGQRNRLGTSNAGGNRSVNAREGDMGVVAVTESGWTLSANVNTWGQPAVTVTGSKDALVGEAVCHSGNTAPNFECGTVNSVNQTVDYGTVVIDGLTLTTACSQGGDSGGAWLSGDKAVGLHSGGVSSCSPGAEGDNSVFQPVGEALTKWGLQLVTGGGNGDSEPPSAPANPRSTATTANSVSLTWDAATDNVGVTGYDVYNGSARATTATGTSATVTGLAADTEYSFTVVAKDAAGNASKASEAVTARTQPGGGGGDRTFGNDADTPIRDFQVAVSRVTSTASGSATDPITVELTAKHTCIQDLNISLVSPAGRWYQLQRYGGYPCTQLAGAKSFTVRPAAGERADGTWTLRIGDNGPGDTGVLDAWPVSV